MNAATVPLTEWSEDMLIARSRARRAVTEVGVSLAATVWHDGPHALPRRALQDVAA